MRRRDADGHLHVESTNISKANVCPYYGREIPDSEALGLDPNRVYMLYRDPAELAAGAKTFENKPLLMQHIPVSADEPAQDLWVGVVGAPAAMKGEYLKAPISIWSAEGIRLIETREQEQLSSAYRYRADMSPGKSPQGVAYDGVMRDIVGNHVALVSEGRAGPDVVVADQLPPELPKMRFSKFLAAFVSMLPTATAIKPEQVVALDKALDEDMEDSDLASAMDAMTEEDKKTACDAYCKAMGKAADALNDEDKKEAYKRAAKDKRAMDKIKGNAAAPAGPVGGAPKPGMDEAAVKLAVDTAVAEATKDFISPADQKIALDKATADAIAANNELHAARAHVAPTVGDVTLESAEKVYRFALDHLKVEHAAVHASALKPLYDASVRVAPPVVAADAAPLNVKEIFPGLSLIRKG